MKSTNEEERNGTRDLRGKQVRGTCRISETSKNPRAMPEEKERKGPWL